MNGINLFEEFIKDLPKITTSHKRGTNIYNLLAKSIRSEIEKSFKNDNSIHNLEPFGTIYFPYHKMGNIDVLNLFDLDEIIIFSFYWYNRKKYKNVADLGANLGLHSVLLEKCGFNVQSYEPDNWHFKIFSENVKKNNCKNIQLNNVAVSNYNGESNFIRVLDNTTGSHIEGAKKNPYGNLEKNVVSVVEFKKIIEESDLMKIDVEGHEVVLLESVEGKVWNTTDALMEVTNEENAKLVYNYFKKNNIKMYSQKNNWNIVESLKDIPTSYKEGTLFVSKHNKPF